MGVNLDVSLSISELENQALYTSQKDKATDVDSDFRSILDEEISSIDKEENFSSGEDGNINKTEKTDYSEKKKIDSDPEENKQVENNDLDDNKQLDSANTEESSEKDVKEDICKEKTETQNDNEENIVEQNIDEIVVDINTDEIPADNLIIQDGVEVDVVQEEIVSDEIISDDYAVSRDSNLEIVSSEVPVDDSIVVNVSEVNTDDPGVDISTNLEEIKSENSSINVDGDLAPSSEQEVVEDKLEVSGNKVVDIVENETNQATPVVTETEIAKDINPQEKVHLKQDESKTIETTQDETLTAETKPQDDLLTQTTALDKTEKVKVTTDNNEKASEQEINNKETIPVNGNQPESEMTFSQEQSSDSPLSDKNFDKTAEQIISKDEDVKSDEVVKDFSVVSEQQDAASKTKNVTADVEAKETDFKEIFQEKLDAAEIMKQVQAKLNVRTDGDTNYSEIKFRLNPDNLGEVSMKITMEDNNLTARMRVENEAIKEVFEANFSELKKALDSQGVKVEKIEVTLKNDASTMGNFSESNSTHERYNKRGNSGSPFFSNSNNSEENENNITFSSRSRQVRSSHSDGHVDFLA